MPGMFPQRVKLHARISFCGHFQFGDMCGKKSRRFDDIVCNPVRIGVDEAF